MAWYNNSWKYRVKVTVKSSQVPSNQTNFPVYLDLATLPPAFHENVRTDGGDIRITSSDEVTELARDLVYYDYTTDSGELHFKAPTISSSVNTVFYVYYGNASATNPAASATYGAYNVWTTSSGVYHLQETANTTSNGYLNSKANSAHGTGTGMGLPAKAVQLGKGAQFNGTTDKITISATNSMANTSSTISAWVDVVSDNTHGTFVKVGLANNGYAIGQGLTTMEDNGNKLVIIYDAVRWQATAATLSVGRHYVNLVISSGGVPSVYLDGVLVGSYSGTNAIAPTTSITIGNGQTGTTRGYNGSVDEVRFMNVARTADWILTEYRNQNAPYTFYNVSVEERRVGDTPQVQGTGILATESLDIPEYTVELWSSTGVYMADVSNILVSGLRMDIPLNDVEQVDFTLDLIQFEEKCARIGADPRNILDPYRTEVKIKRNGAYLLGTQVVQAEVNLNNESANTIEVRTTGYLNLFKDRYITPGIAPATNANVYENQTYAKLAQRLIVDTQNQTNGDFGVIIGVDTVSDTQASTRTRKADYDNQNVKDAILNLCKLETDNFDFKFTWDKQFEVYPRLGTDQPEVELVYPFNVVAMNILRDATTLANKITGMGSGLGEERLQYTATDATSSLAYGIRERIELFNSTSTLATLQTNVNGLIPTYKEIYESLSVDLTNGAIVPGETWVGDAILARVEGSTFIETIDDMYRIINMKINVSNDMEESISLKLVKWS